jgi:nitrile hydratase accessory protein
MSVSTRLADVDAALGSEAPLPRDNGELAFEEPWQGRVLGMGVVALERLGLSWADFREHLGQAIRRRGYDPARPAAEQYYAAFMDALEALLAERGAIEQPAPGGQGSQVT